MRAATDHPQMITRYSYNHIHKALRELRTCEIPVWSNSTEGRPSGLVRIYLLTSAERGGRTVEADCERRGGRPVPLFILATPERLRISRGGGPHPRTVSAVSVHTNRFLPPIWVPNVMVTTGPRLGRSRRDPLVNPVRTSPVYQYILPDLLFGRLVRCRGGGTDPG